MKKGLDAWRMYVTIEVDERRGAGVRLIGAVLKTAEGLGPPWVRIPPPPPKSYPQLRCKKE